MIQCKRNADDNINRRAHSKAACDTWGCIAEFPDGTEAEYSANIIAENMYVQCDLNGQQYLLLKITVDSKRSESGIVFCDRYSTHKRAGSVLKTAKGWALCVHRRDGTYSQERALAMK